MPVQLPNDLVIPDASEIQEINFEPWLKRRALAMYGIEMPVDLSSILKIRVSKQAETVAAKFICLTEDIVGFDG